MSILAVAAAMLLIVHYSSAAPTERSDGWRVVPLIPYNSADFNLLKPSFEVPMSSQEPSLVVPATSTDHILATPKTSDNKEAKEEIEFPITSSELRPEEESLNEVKSGPMPLDHEVIKNVISEQLSLLKLCSELPINSPEACLLDEVKVSLMPLGNEGIEPRSRVVRSLSFNGPILRTKGSRVNIRIGDLDIRTGPNGLSISSLSSEVPMYCSEVPMSFPKLRPGEESMNEIE